MRLSMHPLTRLCSGLTLLWKSKQPEDPSRFHKIKKAVTPQIGMTAFCLNAKLRAFDSDRLLADAVAGSLRQHLGNILLRHIHKGVLVVNMNLTDDVAGDFSI